MNRSRNVSLTSRFVSALSPAAGLLSLIVLSAANAQAPRYAVTDLGTLSSDEFASSSGSDINASGQVTGSSGGQAFLWTPTTPNGVTGSMVGLGTPSAAFAFSGGEAINDRGQVTGATQPLNGNRQAFVWTPTTPNGSSGSMVALGMLGGGLTHGFDINAGGQVTGFGGPNQQTFLWTPTVPNGSTGTMIGLGPLSGSAGNGINDAGQIGGYSGFPNSQTASLWTPSLPNGSVGNLFDLGSLGQGSNNSHGYDINAGGQIVGDSGTIAGTRAFLWTPAVPNGSSGDMLNLGTLGGDFSIAWGLNDHGHVVGSTTTEFGSSRAFLWTNGSGMVDLNTLIDPQTGWVLDSANAINDKGQITGIAYLAQDEFRTPRAFLLTPVPEPSSLLLLTLALPVAIARRQRMANS